MKADYDRAYRTEHRDEILAEKKAYHRRTYDPTTAREYRKRRTFDHAAYCRRYYADPAKKQEKVEYDIARRGAAFANYCEAWRLLIELEREIRVRVPDKYERQKNRGYFDKLKERKHNDHQDRRTA